MSSARLIVDGNNVIGSRPDGWWRDRPGAARRLIASLQALAREGGDRIAVDIGSRPVWRVADAYCCPRHRARRPIYSASMADAVT